MIQVKFGNDKDQLGKSVNILYGNFQIYLTAKEHEFQSKAPGSSIMNYIENNSIHFKHGYRPFLSIHWLSA